MTRWPPLPADVAPVPGRYTGDETMIDKTKIAALARDCAKWEKILREATSERREVHHVLMACSTILVALMEERDELTAQLAAAEARAEKAERALVDASLTDYGQKVVAHMDALPEAKGEK